MFDTSRLTFYYSSDLMEIEKEMFDHEKSQRKLKQLLRYINSYTTGHILFVARFSFSKHDLNVFKSL